jgi:hypothetical protein
MSYKMDIIITSDNVTCSGHNISEKFAHLPLNNNHWQIIVIFMLLINSIITPC